MFVSAIVATDIMCILINIVILYATIFVSKKREERSFRLSLVIAINIVMNAVNVLFYLVQGHYSNLLDTMIISIYCIMGGTYLVLEIKYLYVIATFRRKITRMHFKGFMVASILNTVVSTVLIITGNYVIYRNGELTWCWGYKVVSAYIFVLCTVIVIYLFWLARNMKRMDIMVVASFFMFPEISLILQKSSLQFDFYPAFCTLANIMVYVLFQSKLYDEKQEETEELFNSMASVYTTMFVIDLRQNSYKEFATSSRARQYLDQHQNNDVQEMLWGGIGSQLNEPYKSRILKFADLNTLEERMDGLRKIDCEAIDIDDKWSRFSFVRIDDEFAKIIFAVSDIDRIKKKEKELTIKSHTDALTQIYNRHAYEIDVESIEKKGLGEDLWYINFDLNGLKMANDGRGHVAGDELIVAMAQSMSRAVAPYGKAYRIGGDEFVAILRATKEEINDMLEKLENIRNEWSGKYSEEFSFSKGMACSAEFIDCTMSILEKEADRRMYDEKKKYHQNVGIDRRN